MRREQTGKWAASLADDRGRILAIDGENFSGRTALIRQAIALSREHAGFPRKATPYVGPEIYNVLSGLAASVRGEFALHGLLSPTTSPFSRIIDETGLSALMDRNPFTLSGGEQACLAVLSKLALAPTVIGLDCALEQVSVKLKHRLIGALESEANDRPIAILADNRLDECGELSERVLACEMEVPTRVGRELRFDPINEAVALATEQQTPATLELDAITFSYDRTSPVLREISAALSGGTVYVLEGENGAGKSTLAKLLFGWLRPSAGHFRLAGKDYNPSKVSQRQVAYHFQNPDVQLFTTSVQKEVSVRVRAHRHLPDNGTRQTNRLLAAFGLEHVRQEHPLDLPFAMRKRVALAATFAMDCPWIVLDEPSLGQGDRASRSIASLIQHLAVCGKGVIVISHSVGFRALLNAKMYRLAAGRLEG